MYEVKIDSQKNRMYIILKGYLSEAEVKNAVEEIINAIEQLKPGFSLVNDLSEFKPVSPNAVEYVKQAQTAVFKSGVRKVVRVIKNVIGVMQLKRTQKEAGADYEVIEVNSLEEAERLLDKEKA